MVDRTHEELLVGGVPDHQITLFLEANLCAVAKGLAPALSVAGLCKIDCDPSAAMRRDHALWMDGKEKASVSYGRFPLCTSDIVLGLPVPVKPQRSNIRGHAKAGQ